MHTQELRVWLVNRVPKGVATRLRRTFVRTAFNSCFEALDTVRFKLFHGGDAGTDELEREKKRLVYTWSTYSKDYLQNRHGQDFDHPSRGVTGALVARLAQAYAANGRQPTLLEVPYGMGTDYEYHFSKMPVDYTGMELNPKQVEATRERLPGGRFIQGNILKLDVADRHFDIVYCRHIFEHLSLSAMEAAMRETCRVARRDVVYVFFRMSDTPEHQDNPIRQYHVNHLSLRKTRDFIQSFDCVQDVEVIPVQGRCPTEDNFVFHIRIKPRA